MAFVPWKDRVTATPHRYTLTNVSGDTYDLTAVPGAISEAGTPVNAENLNKLIQRDGDDIKDTVTTFTEASTRANIATGEKTSTIFGKIKKWFADLKSHAFNDLATAQGTETDKAPTNKLLRESTCAAFYRSLTDIDPTFDDYTDMVTVLDAMEINSIASYNVEANDSTVYPSADLQVHIFKTKNNRITCFAYRKVWNNSLQYFWVGGLGGDVGATYRWAGWRRVFTSDDISTVMPLSSAAASNDKVLSEKVVYDEFGKRTAYDKIIRTQAEFDALIASPTWLGAESVALVGQFTYSEANNSGIKVPQTVKQIHGFNGAKITVTNFVYNLSTAKGGLWYDTAPTTLDYSIRDLEVSCDGLGSIGFYNCTNLTNCTGTGTETGAFGAGFGFRNCTKLTNCTGTGTGAGVDSGGFGFSNCTKLTNCTGTGSGIGGYGYGFYNITNASNCRDGGSSTDMWGGVNRNIDVDTCRKTLVTADNTTLNT